MANNEQIDGTDYYRLPSGRQLEDFIADNQLSFALGSAVKYLFRAGRKDGESATKDRAKADHFIRFVSRKRNLPEEGVRNLVEAFVEDAQNEVEAVR